VSSPFVAEVRILPYSFAPKGWAACDGQLLPLSQNTALFSLVGTMYGGNGLSNFALPDLQGSVPIAPNPQGGGGLSESFEGQTGGTEIVTLLDSEIPAHTHSLNALNVLGDNPNPGGHALANYGATTYHAPPVQSPQQLAFQALPVAGGGQPHNNDQPYLTVQFCIALQGVFPSRN
jgi:microcystin-dependent protein